MFIGSSAGGAGNGVDSSGGASGGGSGGVIYNSGGSGGNGTLTVSSNTTNQITNKIISFRLPAESGNDINQNIKTGAISDSVIFIGCGNYGNDGHGYGGAAGGGIGGSGNGGAAGPNSNIDYSGASIALDYENHGYLSQRMIMSFRGMTPGILTLPDDTSFPYIGEFPRANCSSWKTDSETSVNINDFIPPIVDKRANTAYNSPPCFVEPVSGFASSNPSFNVIIINPNGSKVSSQFGAGITTSGKQLGISEQSILYQSNTINDGTGTVDGNGCYPNDAKTFIAILNGEPSDGSKSYYQTFDLSGLKVNDGVELSESNPAKITVRKRCDLELGDPTNKSLIMASGLSFIHI